MKPEIDAAIRAAPVASQAGLSYLRARIHEIARAEGLTVEESLKWGQPSFRAPHGSPLRIGVPKSGGFAIYAHCSTRLMADFATVAPTACIEGNRAVQFADLSDAETQPLDLLIRAALVYHVSR
jgi:hypothetical protein